MIYGEPILANMLSRMMKNDFLPDTFRKLAADSLGDCISEKLIEALLLSNEVKVTSVRLNRQKCRFFSSGEKGSEYFLQRLKNVAEKIFQDSVLKDVPWASGAFYLNKRPDFTFDPFFNAGAYYVQDSSCMFMESVWKTITVAGRSGSDIPFLSFKEPVRVLDLCAAPGGKSTFISDLLAEAAEGSLLVANEVVGSRAAVLAENMSKWGSPNVVVTNNDPADFRDMGSFFDLILVDAPCSGEGMFRKNPDAVGEWSLSGVNLCASRQRRILSDIWPSLRPGGILVYSTCTFNHFENSDNLGFIIEELGGEEIPLDASLFEAMESEGVMRMKGGGYGFVPPFVEGEGQYFAIVRKVCDLQSDFEQTGRGRKDSAQYKRNKRNASGSIVFDGWVEARKGDLIKLFPSSICGEIEEIGRNLRILSSGTAVATVKGKDIIPHADLALSSSIDVLSGYLEKRYGFKYYCIDVDRQSALRFLSKEPLLLPEAPLGYLLLKYEGLGLGFVKNIGSRCNNLLPNARRIRASF